MKTLLYEMRQETAGLVGDTDNEVLGNTGGTTSCCPHSSEIGHSYARYKNDLGKIH
jgi:hypothetical protein